MFNVLLCNSTCKHTLAMVYTHIYIYIYKDKWSQMHSHRKGSTRRKCRKCNGTLRPGPMMLLWCKWTLASAPKKHQKPSDCESICPSCRISISVCVCVFSQRHLYRSIYCTWFVCSEFKLDLPQYAHTKNVEKNLLSIEMNWWGAIGLIPSRELNK